MNDFINQLPHSNFSQGAVYPIHTYAANKSENLQYRAALEEQHDEMKTAVPRLAQKNQLKSVFARLKLLLEHHRSRLLYE